MTFLIIAAILAALLLWYAMKGRAWLKKQPWAQSFFAWIEPIELALYRKSETILVGRLLWVGGLFVTFYDAIAFYAGSLDLTPITTRLFNWLGIPPDMQNLSVTAFIGVLGLLINWLRKRTTKPIELVEAPENSLPPAASLAVAQAEVAKDQAVQAVAEAKS
jgi:hypothetical protein